MKSQFILRSLFLLFSTTILFVSCNDDETDTGGDDGVTPTETDFTDLLTNQIEEVIIPKMINYRDEMIALNTAVEGFTSSIDEANLTTLRTAYTEAYLAYQAVAVHNYFTTANQNLVNTTNLYPIEVELLTEFIENESFLFNSSNQIRANGFPALDYLLYGQDNVVDFFTEDVKRINFLRELVSSMLVKSEAILTGWTGDLRTVFVESGGTGLGSSISVQLNESLIYYEDHIRENKVGIPIGIAGPESTPFEADATKIEAYYQSLADGNEDFTLSLLRTAIEEMENIYLGITSADEDGQGYDDLISLRDQSVDEDIKSQFEAIYDGIDNRSSISGDRTLYDEVQELVSLYKTDLLPLLNVQDADGSNDGD